MKNKMNIGWVVGNCSSYGKAMPSTRIRVYDVMKHLKTMDIPAGFYSFFKRNYNIVIFQKVFTKKHIELAGKLKSKGIKIILDINVDYINVDSKLTFESQKNDIIEMLSLSDAVIASTEHLGTVYKQYNKNTFVIGEIIDDIFFKVKKTHEDISGLYLIYCGQSEKSGELYLIKDVLKELNLKYGVKLLLICEKKPSLEIIPFDFVKFNYAAFPRLLLKGDIKIAPRDLSKSYNLGHSFTKIGYPMSIGLPVAASPVPSYLNSPAFLSADNSKWYEVLESLIKSSDLRNEVGCKGINFVRQNYSKEHIMPKYLQLFNTVISSI